VDGWRVLVPKTGKFFEGTLGIFMEVDTWLPANTSFEKFFSRPARRSSFVAAKVTELLPRLIASTTTPP